MYSLFFVNNRVLFSIYVHKHPLTNLLDTREEKVSPQIREHELQAQLANRTQSLRAGRGRRDGLREASSPLFEKDLTETVIKFQHPADDVFSSYSVVFVLLLSLVSSAYI